jgi:hypothetical protein
MSRFLTHTSNLANVLHGTVLALFCRMGAAKGEMWIPRTMWEKRRQLSASIHRALMASEKVLLLSCDNWTTFFGRLDVSQAMLNEALSTGWMEYVQVSPQYEGRLGTDLSRVLGEISQRFQDKHLRKVIMDDVDLMLDLGSPEALKASVFALLYALGARFDEILLFSNPLRSDAALDFFSKSGDFLTVHLPSTRQQSAA